MCDWINTEEGNILNMCHHTLRFRIFIFLSPRDGDDDEGVKFLNIYKKQQGQKEEEENKYIHIYTHIYMYTQYGINKDHITNQEDSP